ncbi:MAG: hypothetical protein ACQKBY_02580 [Verrucomicrobiales bacterium]
MSQFSLGPKASLFTLLLCSAPVYGVVTINEVRVSLAWQDYGSGNVDADTYANYIELHGTPGESVDGLSVLVVSAEYEPGQVDFRFDLSGNIASDGLFLIGDDFELQNYIPQTDGVDQGEYFDLFGSPAAIFLAETAILDAASADERDDLDTDNDGVLESPFAFLDAVSLSNDDVAGNDPDYFYGAGSALYSGLGDGFSPAHIYRVRDGVDSDSSSDWAVGSYQDYLGDTPGGLNAVPEPSFAWLGVLAGGLFLVRRRK